MGRVLTSFRGLTVDLPPADPPAPGTEVELIGVLSPGCLAWGDLRLDDNSLDDALASALELDDRAPGFRALITVRVLDAEGSEIDGRRRAARMARQAERRTMATMAALADAALDERELQVLERFVAALKKEYGDDLDAVWLYGARARGERPNEESDVDVLVVTRSRRDDEPLLRTLWQVIDELGNPRVLVDARQRSRAWVEDRRAIDSFFLREVDRDRIVLHGALLA